MTPKPEKRDYQTPAEARSSAATNRRLTVMEAHTATECPDRATCWAADIHNLHGAPWPGESVPAEVTPKHLDYDADEGGWVCQMHGVLSCHQHPECVASVAVHNLLTAAMDYFLARDGLGYVVEMLARRREMGRWSDG